MKEKANTLSHNGNDKQNVNTKPSFSSPTSAVSAEETRILNEHISQQNMFKIIAKSESRRKTLTLKKFFKMKRNQQVIVTTLFEKEGTSTVEGKVAAIGRDFVMLTNLQKRLWIPFTTIESATIPFGMPTYSNTHQHHIYDNQLQQKLVLRFGETIAKRDALVQQFFEESLRTNLYSWKGTWVEVITDHQTLFGKMIKTDKEVLILQLLKNESHIPLKEIQMVSTVRLLTLWREVLKSMF